MLETLEKTKRTITDHLHEWQMHLCCLKLCLHTAICRQDSLSQRMLGNWVLSKMIWEMSPGYILLTFFLLNMARDRESSRQIAVCKRTFTLSNTRQFYSRDIVVKGLTCLWNHFFYYSDYCFIWRNLWNNSVNINFFISTFK